ncbi:sam domain family protein [Gigaspora margarita]|uniref:Sam domain family protein n=1 Tax=Gigaspora margarita TaxID=4874 RepID=A0A8H3X8C1_GIGMA|nr:sam domain family protein [Gigaspora margarita]
MRIFTIFIRKFSKFTRHFNKHEDMLVKQERREKFYKENYIDKVNYKLLEDFPMWLGGFELGYLSHLFRGKKWQEIIKMNYKDLEKLGVLSFRNRATLIRNFLIVRRHLAEEKIEFSNKGNIEKKSFENEKKLNYLQFYEKNYVNVNFKLLEDFPAWLNGIKLAHLAKLFEGKEWYEIIEMTKDDLKDLGVTSSNARNKLIANFWHIKRKLYSSTAATSDKKSSENKDMMQKPG